MINPGKLNQKINVLTLKGTENYSWENLGKTWAEIEYLDKINLFSRVGIGVKSIKFIIRKRDLTLHNAFKWQNNHYFLTDIKEVDRMYLEVITAQIEPRTCTLTRSIIEKDELNRPIEGQETNITFPGCLIEKYMGYQQLIPQAVNDLTYVLVTPKVINLEVGDLVKISNDTFNVQIIHNLDEYKNEYEINIIKEA